MTARRKNHTFVITLILFLQIVAFPQFFAAPALAFNFSTPTAEAQVHFKSAALDGLSDIMKDISDSRIALTGYHPFKLLANIATIEIHIAVLDTRVAKPPYKTAFDTNLKKLEAAVNRYVAIASAGKIAQSRSSLNDVEKSAKALIAVVQAIK